MQERHAEPLVRPRRQGRDRRARRKGIGEDLALRVYTTRLLGGEPKLVLHGGGNTSVKTNVRRHRRRRRSRCCASRAAAGTWARSRRPACRRCGSRRCGSCTGCRRCRDEDMVNVQRSNLFDSKLAQSVGRDAAARLPAAQVHRPHPFQRRAGADRPARRRRRWRPTSTASARPRALRHAGLRARQEVQRGRRRPIPTSKA